MYAKLEVSVILICAIFGTAHGRDVVSDSSTFGCSVDEFLCKNGECIDSTSVCDGTLHCKDGSDEPLFACGFFSKKFSSISARMRRAVNLATVIPCVAPPQPKNGTRKVNRFLCNADEDCDVAEGSSLNAGSQLTYVCEPGFKLDGNSHVYCTGQGKWSPIPVCKEIKCEALITESMSAICFRRGNRTNCKEPVLPGTQAEVSCRAGYKREANSALIRHERIKCKTDGEWHPRPIICSPACGVAIDRTTPFVLHGSIATVADFPWHATLYEEVYKEEGPVKEFRCGATVIHTKLVLTAAHCVYDERTKSTTDSNTLHVATGNVFREFDSPLHDSNIVQKSPVRNVWRYCWYHGLAGNYLDDIALLELQKPFRFSSILMPACLEISGFSNQILESGSFGRVAGFGVTQNGVASAILQTITVPYVSYAICRNSRQGSQDEVFISRDKFCAGNINGTQAVCSGDSGGGLVFKKNDRWYVMGIVSVALGVNTTNGESRCGINSYTLYTNVANYIDWIRNIVYRVETNGYFPSCGNTSPSVTTPAVSPIVPNVTTVTPSTTRITRPRVRSPGFPCELPNGWRTSCASEKDCPYTVTKFHTITYFRTRYCSFIYGIPNSCCQSKVLVTASPVTSSPTSALPTAPQTGRNATINEESVGYGRSRIAGQKCAAYASSILPNSSSTIGDIQCTYNQPPERIRARPYTDTNERPYMAKIGFNTTTGGILWNCGAILISENYVISLQFCFSRHEDDKAAWVRLGNWNNNTGAGINRQQRRIIEVVRHPSRDDYTPSDVTLFKMDRPVTFDASILPACLHASQDVDTSNPVTVTGWLRHDSDQDLGPSVYEPIARMLEPRTIDTRTNRLDHIDDQRIIHTILYSARTDCMELEDGAALFVSSNNLGCMKQLVGISDADECGHYRYHFIYLARIFPYIGWIESIVWMGG